MNLRGFGIFLARKLIGITREAGGVKVHDFAEQTRTTKGIEACVCTPRKHTKLDFIT